jgi:prepilin-type N-terminal cleavage/methylation domain-containing protein
MKSAETPAQNGFTLVEVLVALLVSALLLTILFDGLIASQERSRSQRQASQALALAANLLEERRDAGPIIQSMQGTKNGFAWRVAEEEIARDPRQVFALVGVKAEVGTPRAPRLINLERRFMRKVQ